ncbi:MAG: GntR family transcriptional regulator [Lentisphaerae bacterium]|nr:MAG: GntR family transcriptional regulator [Lentisphaerota bacterium]
MANQPKFKRNSDTPLYQQAKEHLIREFQKYQLHEKLPTDRALAKSLKLSFLTVNKVMNQLAREGYVVRQRGKGTFLASYEQTVFSDEVTGANGQVIVAHPNYPSVEYWTRVHTAEEFCLRHGLKCVEIKLNPNTSWERVASLAKRQEALRAVLIQPVPGSVTEGGFKLLDSLGCPIVWCYNSPFLDDAQNSIAVIADWFRIGYLEMECLLRHGHRRIVKICNEPPGQDGGETIRGMKQAVADHALPPSTLAISRETGRPWENSAHSAYELTLKVFTANRDVTGLIYDSVAGVWGGLRALWELGLKVPDDVSLVSTGIRDGIDAYMPPPLTTVCPDPEEEVRKGLELALDWHATGRKPSLITRISPTRYERMSVRTCRAGDQN